ncbi:MAG: hypothetical protein EOP53_09335 [Sphingobacteriales bacterium]|nr:MAG: hypothetical protein EOP53_09335 [Sphingobacteriales bacterium]
MKYALCHLVFIVLLFGIYRTATNQRFYPDNYRLNYAYDVGHYNSIKTNGYSFNPEKQSNVAFFPGFPYFWRFLGVSARGITIVNIVIFYIGIFLWMHFFHPARNEVLLYLSLPSMMFIYLPYSEPLFFITCMIFLIGFQKNNTSLILTGLVLSSMTRSAGNIFIPALILLELISANRSWKKLILYIGVSLLSIGLVSFIQFYQTGTWFGFMQTQKHWDHHLSFPELPFRTWGNVLLLDAGALVAAFSICCITIYHIYNYFKYKITINNKAYLFSLLAISGLTAITLLFKVGSLFSLNRYFIPTAFFAVAGGILYGKLKLKPKEIGFAALGIFLFLALFHFFRHISFILEFALLTAYLSLYLFVKHPNLRISRIAFWSVYLINCGLQVYLLDYFLHKQWVG